MALNRATVATCDICGYEEVIHETEVDLAEDDLHDLGWVIWLTGRTEAKHYCPACAGSHEKA